MYARKWCVQKVVSQELPSIDVKPWNGQGLLAINGAGNYSPATGGVTKAALVRCVPINILIGVRASRSDQMYLDANEPILACRHYDPS